MKKRHKARRELKRLFDEKKRLDRIHNDLSRQEYQADNEDRDYGFGERVKCFISPCTRIDLAVRTYKASQAYYKASKRYGDALKAYVEKYEND